MMMGTVVSPTAPKATSELILSTTVQTSTAHDAWPSDANRDTNVLGNDIIILFLGKVFTTVGNPAYSARSDLNADGSILGNDVDHRLPGQDSSTPATSAQSCRIVR